MKFEKKPNPKWWTKAMVFLMLAALPEGKDVWP